METPSYIATKQMGQFLLKKLSIPQTKDGKDKIWAQSA